MAAHDTSILGIIQTAIHDGQDLIRGEIALAKSEMREEVRRLGAGAALLAGALLAGMIALVFLLIAVAWGLSEGLGWPVWAGFGSVAAVLLIAAGVFAYLGRSRIGRDRHMPLTVDTVKENVQWMRARAS